MFLNVTGSILIPLFILIPTAALIWFIVSLILFLIRPKGSPTRRFWRIHMIVSGIVAGVLIGVIISLVALFILAMAGM